MFRKELGDELFGAEDYEDELTNNVSQKENTIELGEEFKKILGLLENTSDCYFITGRAGTGKCYGENEEIIMYDGTYKKVQDIKNNDLLMGPDSKSRTVISTTKGKANLFKIIPVKGEPFVVNGDHILSLKVSYNSMGYKKNEITDIPVNEYINKNTTFKKIHKLYRVPIDFSSKKITIEPYFLGIWLGDGNSAGSRITSADKEIYNYLKEYSIRLNYKLSIGDIRGVCANYNINNGNKGTGRLNTNSLQYRLRELKLINNKHIPDIYLHNSREIRLSLLAGLIDSDGSKNSESSYEITSKWKHLAEQIQYLARSLGFGAYISEKIATIKDIDFKSIVYRVNISGDISLVPVLLHRKSGRERRQIKNVLHTGFSIESIGNGNFYGFELDGDHLHLNKGFIVNHNSTLLREFRQTTKKEMVVLSPTGIAAVNVEGQTIHSFFRFPPEILFPETVRQLSGKDIFRKLDAIVIDEISMVRSDIIDAIDIMLRTYGPFSFKPFGGIQMIFFGDLYQLPPVVKRDDAEPFYSMYTGTWFFNSKVISDPDMNLKTMELTKIYRQTEPEFIDILEKIRNNTMQQSDLDRINSRHDPFTDRPEGEIYLTLTTINQTAKEINNKKLNALSGPPKIYSATVEGQFREEIFPADKDLILKKDTQVIFLKNDTEGRWANGTIGRVESLHNDHVMVEVKTNYGTAIYRVEKATWVNIKYESNKATKKVKSTEIGKFKQYPLKLAYAISIHRAQGQTFDNVDIHFGSGTFVSGHAYVALSRARTLGGIKLLTKLSHRDIMLDNQVVEFLEKSKYLEENPLQG